MTAIILIILSYLSGSVSYALLISRAHGKDLRSVGSGNLGATNLSRLLGKKWAYLCFGLDVLKGAVPMLAARLLLISKEPTPAQLTLWLIVGIAAILGHVFPFYLKFRGGKGAATSFGVVLGLWPYLTVVGLIVFIIWVICVLIWKYISLGSIIAAAAFPVVLIICTAVIDHWHFKVIWPLIIAVVLLAALVIILHRKNIRRLLDGTENKVLQKNNHH